MRVSIIIPAYNAAAFLAETIESCLAQTYPALEIIVVDDESTDNTHQVAARYPQVTYIRQVNQGPAGARNNGIQHSSGDFLQFLDADDILLPAKIEKCLQKFEQYPEAGVVYTDYEDRSHDLRQPVSKQRPAFYPEGQILHDAIYSTASRFPIHAGLVRRDPVKQIGGFDTRAFGTEDWLFWVRLAAAGVEFRHVDEKLVWYRDIGTSVSKNQLRMAENRLNAMAALRDIELPADIDLDSLLAGRHHVVAMKHWEAGNHQTARLHLREALRLHPGWGDRLLLAMSYGLSASTAEKIIHVLQRWR